MRGGGGRTRETFNQFISGRKIHGKRLRVRGTQTPLRPGKGKDAIGG